MLVAVSTCTPAMELAAKSCLGWPHQSISTERDGGPQAGLALRGLENFLAHAKAKTVCCGKCSDLRVWMVARHLPSVVVLDETRHGGWSKAWEGWCRVSLGSLNGVQHHVFCGPLTVAFVQVGSTVCIETTTRFKWL
ncbi:uncharacterized protein MELLADRAFT_86065 [Melampsora larici-populina 98AG31]|uniref:Uncharacterized protein n=1 Tax=Melampsora larici-populina (strain 98AG31 / pathotype 3-4-7) TaxID=747676 RepID=F4RKN1_MELLP|nr:uncharacterized protein MELLADRAFT_86065 [Melampsora larici-populina 98AG31]EGG07150.1 hypothetical protein MELLADRAFT_86065 [Melampsora larici-populina 98AG31]